MSATRIRKPAPSAADGSLAPHARETRMMRACIGALALFLLLAIALPLAMLLAKSFQNGDGDFVFLANYVTYFSTPALSASLWNSVAVAGVTTAIVIPLAFVYAYALTRTMMPAKGLFTALALLPLFAPSLLSALSLIYLFGNQGLLKSWLFGASVYGPIGIVMAQVLYCFPHALLVLITALRMADQRLYEVAQALGASHWRVFVTVTLPGVKYGLVSAAILVFTLAVTDFGIAKVIGGQFNVLATDVYKQVVGQQNFAMGAVVAMVLLAPAVLAFLVERRAQRRQVALLSAQAVPLAPKRSRLLDRLMTVYCLLVAGMSAGVFLVAAWASFITYWPYNLTLSFKWYDFTEFEPNGWGPYFTSLKMATLTSLVGTAVVFMGAYLIEKGRGAVGLRGLARFLATIPMAVPGLVLGLGYVFVVNASWSPLGVLYGTIALLAINSIAHFYTTAHMTATAALKQIDAEIEAVSQSLKVPFYSTFWRVTVPICLPTILDIAVYLFVNAMTTVSAVIFLYGPTTKLAAISIVHMDEAGATAAAAAMATLVVATALVVKVLHALGSGLLIARTQAWRRR